MARALSYKPDKEGHECPVDKDDEPCWGPVEANDWLNDGESFLGIPIYTCSGHVYIMCQSPHNAYIPEPPTFEGSRICKNCKHSERLHMKVLKKDNTSCMDVSCNCKEFK